jgi:hypothetical protein
MTRATVPSFRSFAKLAFAAVLAPVVVVVAGCNDQSAKPPRAVLQSNLGPGEAGSAKCIVSPNDADWLVIGQPGAPVNTGDEYAGAPVSIECSVIPDNGAFAVQARASVSKAGEKSGTIYIVGTFPADKSAPVKVQASFQKDIGNYEQADCDVTYEAGTAQGVAAGRVWGKLRCPHMIEAAKSQDCEGTAEFKFENCIQ